MEYQKLTNLLHNASNQPSKSRTKNWINQEGLITLLVTLD